jgi:hypothetical protein
MYSTCFTSTLLPALAYFDQDLAIFFTMNVLALCLHFAYVSLVPDFDFRFIRAFCFRFPTYIGTFKAIF